MEQRFRFYAGTRERVEVRLAAPAECLTLSKSVAQTRVDRW
jgi:hypothetical protein